MSQPDGYVVPGLVEKVCRLLRALYGLKQAPLQWHKKLHAFLLTLGFRQCYKDQCLYVRHATDNKRVVYLAVYVDDIALASPSTAELQDVANAIKAEFATTDKGKLDFILGIKVTRDREQRTVHMHQAAFVYELLDRFHMRDCHTAPTPQVIGHAAEQTDNSPVEDPSVPYQSLVGALQYLVTATRLDIANAVRFLASHTITHWHLAKRVV